MKIENHYSMPLPNMPGTSGQFLAVLTSGSAGDFAVYLGITQKRFDGPIDADLELVAHHGLKISYLQAIKYFAYLKPEQYRD